MRQISLRNGRAWLGFVAFALLGCTGGFDILGFSRGDEPASQNRYVLLTPNVVQQGVATDLNVKADTPALYTFTGGTSALNTALGSRSASPSGVTNTLTVPNSVPIGLYSLTTTNNSNLESIQTKLFVIGSEANHKMLFPATVELDTPTYANLASILPGSTTLVSKLEAIGLPSGITMSAGNYGPGSFNTQTGTGYERVDVRLTGSAPAGTYPFKLRWSTATALIEEVDSSLTISSVANNSIRIFDQNNGAEIASPWGFVASSITFPSAAGYPFNMVIKVGSQSLTIRSTSALTARTYATPYDGLELIFNFSGKTYRSSYGTVIVNSVSSGRADISIPLVTMMGDPATNGNFSIEGRIVK